MRAADLTEDFPTVALSDDAVTAARMIGEGRRPGLIVREEDGKPHSVLGASQVLRFMIPAYVQEDPRLAQVYGDDIAQELIARLAGKTVKDLLPQRQERDKLPVVERDATPLEIAAVMAQRHSPLVAVLDDAGHVAGAVTAGHLLERIFQDRLQDGGAAAS